MGTPLRDCYVCGGDGYVVDVDEVDADTACEACDGTGKVPYEQCKHPMRARKDYTSLRGWRCAICGHVEVKA